MSQPPIDLTVLPPDQATAALGEVAALCLQSSRACLLLQREDGAVSIVHPRELRAISDEDMAALLLRQGWGDADILDYLSHR